MAADSQTTAPQPGQVWVQTKPPSSRKRIVTQPYVDPGPDVVSYKTNTGIHRQCWLREWNEWVARYRCEVENHGH
jgi:hypothetical protein